MKISFEISELLMILHIDFSKVNLKGYVDAEF